MINGNENSDILIFVYLICKHINEKNDSDHCYQGWKRTLPDAVGRGRNE